MADIPSEIIANTKTYLDVLKQHGFKIITAYRFGSYARGDWNEGSDIDIAIVSDSFEGNRFLDRQKLIGLHRKIDLRISPLPFNTSDFANSILYDEIISMGVKIE